MFLLKGYNKGYKKGYNFSSILMFITSIFLRYFVMLNTAMRDKTLIQKRDKAIVDKFHELYDVKRKRIDDVLKELSENYFYLDCNYIYARIFYNKENNEYYNSLVERK